MKVSIPPDPDGSWRTSLLPTQRERLAEVARGDYAEHREHVRIVVVKRDDGFDIIGLKHVAVVDESGDTLPDAYGVAWIDRVEPRWTSVDSLHVQMEYGYRISRTRRHGSQRYEVRKQHGKKFARTVVRRERRERRSARRRAEREAAELAKYEAGLTEHIAAGLNPMTYHPEDYA